MAEKEKYAKGSKPRKAETTKSEKVEKQLGNVGKGLAIGLGTVLVGGLAGGIHHARETARIHREYEERRPRRIKVKRPDNL